MNVVKAQRDIIVVCSYRKEVRIKRNKTICVLQLCHRFLTLKFYLQKDNLQITVLQILEYYFQYSLSLNMYFLVYGKIHCNDRFCFIIGFTFELLNFHFWLTSFAIRFIYWPQLKITTSSPSRGCLTTLSLLLTNFCEILWFSSCWKNM